MAVNNALPKASVNILKQQTDISFLSMLSFSKPLCLISDGHAVDGFQLPSGLIDLTTPAVLQRCTLLSYKTADKSLAILASIYKTAVFLC